MRYRDWHGKQASMLGFGCGSVMGRVGRAASLRAMHLAWERGITLFDTARSYGYGDAESLLGEFLAGRRDRAIVITKFGILPGRRSLFKQLAKPIVRAGLALLPQARSLVRRAAGASGELTRGHFDIATLRSSLDTSLRALRTDHVDALLLHLPPLSVFAQHNLIAELLRLRDAGKVRTLGVSTDDPVVQEHTLAHPALAAVLQAPMPMLQHTPSPPPLPTCAETRIMGNHLFGGEASVRHAVAAFAQWQRDATFSPELRDKLRGNPRSNPRSALAEVVFHAARQQGAQFLICSMLQPDHVLANTTALSQPALTADEASLLLAHLRTQT